MKKGLLCIVFFFAGIFLIQAQSLYGTTSRGGNEGGGAINKFIALTKSLRVVKSFEAIPISANIIHARNGRLYGSTYGGGNNDFGVIFSLDPSVATYTKLKDFDGINGANPSGSLMQASNGKLYGMTYGGGKNGFGVIYSFDPSSSTYTNLKDFDFINGGNPSGNSLIQARDGKLYGMTTNGGSGSGGGVIFSFDLSTSTYTKLKDFDLTNGSAPFGNLIEASDGKLYGMTSGGGSNNVGTIFSFDPLSSTYLKLKDFENTNGGNPSGSLIEASDGKLYGLAGGGSSHNGVIFSFDPLSFTYIKLIDFDGINGSDPNGSLMRASDGKLYGLAGGGSSNYGVIFSFDPSSSIYEKRKNFDRANGRGPSGSLIQANDGKLYGTTVYGEIGGGSVIFSFDPVSSSYTKLKDFGTNENGSNPYGSLTQASDEKLYGMTGEGGSRGGGVIFSFDPVSSKYAKLKDFDGVNGALPIGNLIQASDGRLYGTTFLGGRSDVGVIFCFDPLTSTYTKLKDFNGSEGTNRGHPTGSLIQASDGKLYGITYDGEGDGFYGVIFCFDLASSTYTVLHNFDYLGGANPISLIQASDRKLYGMTSSGGRQNSGVIFSFDPVSSLYTSLKEFDGTNGAHPRGSLVQASNGKLYGIAGVIFSFDLVSSVYTRVFDFSGTDVGFAANGFMQASDGKLYGTTSNGGSKDYGVIFSFDPSTATYTKLKDFTGANGISPGSRYIEVISIKEPPVVKITAPAGNTTYVGAALVHLIAEAKDPGGSITKVEFYSGDSLLRTEYYSPYSWNWKEVPAGNYAITAKAYDDDGAFTISSPVHVSVVPNKRPAVKILNPVNTQVIPGPAIIGLQADAKDQDGIIEKVEFYNGNILLRTEYFFPYSWNWKNVPVGNYTITAKAYDNNGGVNTSAPVQIFVVPNKSPLVNIAYPVNHQTISGPAKIALQAEASDPDGTVSKVAFYNGPDLLRTEYLKPYTWNWKNVVPGTYTISARATDNLGGTSISSPVTVTVMPAAPSLMNQTFVIDKISISTISNGVSIKLAPNPVNNILKIYTNGFQQNNKLTISIISVPGVVIKTFYAMPASAIQTDASSLSQGNYILKVASADMVLYAQFLKL